MWWSVWEIDGKTIVSKEALRQSTGEGHKLNKKEERQVTLEQKTNAKEVINK